MRKKFKEMQDRFSQEFIIDLNATQAAIRAGYSKKTARIQGCQLLTKLNIQTKIQELQVKRSEKTEITAEYVVNSLKDIADDNKKEKPIVAVRALEQLGKHLGIFKETAPHPEREKARRDLQEDECIALRKLARRRTAELSNEN